MISEQVCDCRPVLQLVVKGNDGQVVWEDGENRSFKVRHVNGHDAQMLHCGQTKDIAGNERMLLQGCCSHRHAGL